jgi:hypothetical protein
MKASDFANGKVKMRGEKESRAEQRERLTDGYNCCIR